jgi:hypothetical protein
MSEITIKKMSKEVVAWNKDIEFEYQGKTYLVTLNWDNYDGYDITFKNKTNETPLWASRWIEEGEYAQSLLVILDEMTEREGESNA